MNDAGSTLVAHCGARKVTREELKEIPVPEGTRTHQPLSHYEIVDVLDEALSFRHLEVKRDEYAVSGDGMKMFGVMDLSFGFEGANFSIGLRNSNDKSMRLALTAGYRVFVCDNMAFSGDFTPLLQKHTRSLALRDSISIAVDRICRSFNATEMQVRAMREFGLTDNDAKLLIYRVFMERAIRGVPRSLMPVVHEHYFKPAHEDFAPRNLWSISNAFTSAFKKLTPVTQFEATARFGSFLTGFQEDMKQRSEEGQVALSRDIVVPFTADRTDLSSVANREDPDESVGSRALEDWSSNEVRAMIRPPDDAEQELAKLVGPETGSENGSYEGTSDESEPDSDIDGWEHMRDDLIEEQEEEYKEMAAA
ncbi:MAG TPA: hypothetical protein PKA76_15300 [Pirellulaceae bacterium]|nr:hypothetical protein [Pyrinomonadaceae bacterium]HMP65586.1 hypothetical protein [Pyrinomonadaceae bacterium]HMP70711.1 hypothetical protein [Pirellulaceae bacterium]